MNINSSSYYSVGASSTSKGLSGLASGIDTETMVKQMLSGTQSKIDKQQQLKQQTLWKQDIYRDIISSVNSFRNKYFDTSYGSTLSTNLAGKSFFNTMSSKIKKGSGINIVSSSSSAMTGDMSVVVKQLASNAKLTGKRGSLGGNKSISSAKINDSTLKNFDKKVSLNVGGSKVTVDLNKASSKDDIVNAFNTALKDKGVKASMDDKGQLTLKGDSGTSIKVDKASTSLGLAMTGLADVSSSSDGSTLSGSAVNVNAGVSFNLSLDGVQKTITISNAAGADGTVTAESLKDALSAQVKKAFGSYVDVGLEDGALTLKSSVTNDKGEMEPGHQLTITGADATKLGFTPGATTQVSMGSTLNSLGLEGDRFSFNINGTDFTFNGSDDLSTVINTVNSSDAGVRISYSSISDNFVIETKSSGKGYGITMEQKEGNLLSKMFGADVVGGASAVSGNQTFLTTSNTLSASSRRPGLADGYTTKRATMDLTVNGKDYTFNLAEKKNKTAYTKQEVEKEFNKWLETTFGKAADGSANISYSTDGTLHMKDGFQVEIAKSKANLTEDAFIESAGKLDLGVAMGFAVEGVSNAATDETKLSDILQFQDLAGKFVKDGVDTADLTLADLKGEGVRLSLIDADGNATEATVSYNNGRLTLANTEGKTFRMEDNAGLERFFSSDSISFGDGQMKVAAEAGTDAVVVINGIETSRTSNSFSIDGITMELTDVSKLNDDGTYEETVISTARDVDKIVEGFKSFVEDYNAMLEKLNGYVDADAEYKDYAPLTSEQKKEMSEREIELWEEKAKTGLIRRDSDVDSFLSQMRTALYTKPAGSKYSLFDIGIETTSNYKDKGKLQIDEVALRNALSSDPSAVEELFLNKQEGLAAKMTSIIDATAKQTGSVGSLVKLAGVKGSYTEKNNTIYSNLQSIESRIKDLQKKYEQERTRYWNQFNAMESILANYNSQSMWMSSAFGGSGY